MSTPPLWAILAGAALKAPDAVNNYVGLYNTIQGARDAANMSDAARKLSQFATVKDIDAYDPTSEGYLSAKSLADYAKVRDAKKTDIYTRESDAVMPGFTDQYNDLTGGGARFYSDPESRAELIKNGLVIPNGGNPITAARLTDFAKRGQLEQQYLGGNSAELAANPFAKEQSAAINQAIDLEKYNREDAEKAEATRQIGRDNEFRTNMDYYTREPNADSMMRAYTELVGETRPTEATAKAGYDDLMKFAKDVYGPTQTGKVGRTTYTYQKNRAGDEKKDAQSTAPVIKINNGDGSGTKDAPKIFYLIPPGGGTPRPHNWNNPKHKALYQQRENEGWMDVTTSIVPNIRASAAEQGRNGEGWEPWPVDDKPASKSGGEPDLETAKKLMKKYGSIEKAQSAFARGER